MGRLYFLVLDVDTAHKIVKAQVDGFQELIKKHHPEIEFEGTEPQIPAFP